MKQNCQTTCVYVTVVFAILWSQGGVGFEYFHDLRRSGCGGKLFEARAETEFKNEIPSASGTVGASVPYSITFASRSKKNYDATEV